MEHYDKDEISDGKRAGQIVILAICSLIGTGIAAVIVAVVQAYSH